MNRFFRNMHKYSHISIAYQLKTCEDYIIGYRFAYERSILHYTFYYNFHNQSTYYLMLKTASLKILHTNIVEFALVFPYNQ